MSEHDDDLDLEDCGDDGLGEGVNCMDEHWAGANRMLATLGNVMRRAAVAQQGEPAQAAPTEGQRFLQAFGRMGGVWFAEGKTFAEAEALYAVLMPKPLSNLQRVLAGIKIERP